MDGNVFFQFKPGQVLPGDIVRHLKAIDLILRYKVDKDIFTTYAKLLQLSGELIDCSVYLLIAFRHGGAFLQDAEDSDVLISLEIHQHARFNKHSSAGLSRLSRRQDYSRRRLFAPPRPL